MKKVCLVYVSMTGNTEEIKDVMEKTLSDSINVDCYQMDVEEAEIISEYDYILLGSYTYDDGDIPFEAEDFYEELGEMDLSGKCFACFGSGDTLYPHFCNAPVLFEERIKERGGVIMQPTLKVELSPSDDDQMEKCVQFAKNVCTYIKEDHS